MPQIKAVIFCEQVRQELNGKLMVIGTYTGQLSLQAFPFHGMTQLILIADDVGDNANLKIKIGTRSGAIFAEMEAELQKAPHASDEGGAWLTLPPVALTLSSPDVIEVSTSFEGEPFVVSGVLPVMQAEYHQ